MTQTDKTHTDQTQTDRAQTFRALHVPGDPLVLYNIWDAATAAAVAGAGARALATGSWSVAGAQGYPDGEAIPLDFLLRIVGRIAETCALPLSVDFEGAYATDPDRAAANVGKVIAAGAIGINFEDGILGGTGCHPIDAQCARIAAIRAMADATGVALFINARTDLFLRSDAADHAAHLPEARDRATAFAEAGADGFFVPGLRDPDLIAAICAHARLPVNVMMGAPGMTRAAMAGLGAARLSYGPAPYRAALDDIAARVRALD